LIYAGGDGFSAFFRVFHDSAAFSEPLRHRLLISGNFHHDCMSTAEQVGKNMKKKV
jgi:hypothetical protein